MQGKCQQPSPEACAGDRGAAKVHMSAACHISLHLGSRLLQGSRGLFCLSAIALYDLLNQDFPTEIAIVCLLWNTYTTNHIMQIL